MDPNAARDALARARDALESDAASDPAVLRVLCATLCDALEAALDLADERWDAIGRLAPAAKRLRGERDRLARQLDELRALDEDEAKPSTD